MALHRGRAHISAGLLITVSCEISRITLSLIGTCTLSGSPQRRFKIPLMPLTASARERRPGSDHCPNAFMVIDAKELACRSTVIDNTDRLITHLRFFPSVPCHSYERDQSRLLPQRKLQMKMDHNFLSGH